MIHDAPALPLQIPPLAGARCNAPQPTTIQGEDAGAPAGVSPLFPRPGTALEAIAAERTRQVEQFGHTPESDAALPLKQLPRQAARFVSMAIEDCQFQAGDWRKAARSHLVRAGAMVLAAIDRIDAEPADDFLGETSL